MITVKKNVYYCEFCNKRSLSGGHMRNHESRCTANQNRSCGFCEKGSISEIIEGFKKRFRLERFDVEDNEGNKVSESFDVIWNGDPVTLDEVKLAADNCPVCIFSIIRQCKFNHHYFKEAFVFDFKKELEAAWHERRSHEEPEIWL